MMVVEEIYSVTNSLRNVDVDVDVLPIILRPPFRELGLEITNHSQNGTSW